ncbi:MAG: NUDIX hydrolase [Pseudomonadales bacterium]|nr:NUDIX hydrolase [Pseudomonadales bacterium]MBO6594552.1 NUDIX hydrolase [Pseudomonadales bacterium]MBO6655513.1 NUDIX hydrolase [Pseudomonadales bacterium]MBO6821887.1 NUDIX hydrolase [Pseudomonadales bacterium]
MSEIRPWVRKETRQLADCRVFTVSESISMCPRTDNAHSFYVIDTADWVNIVPITINDEVVFIRQFRHGTEQITLEIPGGMVDPGEDPGTAAVRECMEESGFTAGDVESLGILRPNPAIFPNKLHTFVATGCERTGEIANTSTEHTEVELVPLADLPRLLQEGAIDHALVVATLWRMLYLKQSGM